MVAWADDLFRTDAVPPDLRAGDLVSVTVRRDGAMAEVPVVLQRSELGPPLFAAFGAFVFGTLLFGVAAFVFRRRPGDPAAAALLLHLRRSILQRPAVPLGPEPARRRVARAVLGVCGGDVHRLHAAVGRRTPLRPRIPARAPSSPAAVG